MDESNGETTTASAPKQQNNNTNNNSINMKFSILLLVLAGGLQTTGALSNNLLPIVHIEMPSEHQKIRGPFHLVFKVSKDHVGGLFSILINDEEEMAIDGNSHNGGRFVVALPGMNPGDYTLKIRYVDERKQVDRVVKQLNFSSISVQPAVINQPKVSGSLKASVRRRGRNGDEIIKTEILPVATTGIIVMDMWQYHACVPAMLRIQAMIPRFNEVLIKARNNGIQIIHAPSLGGPEYEGTVQRKRMQEASFKSPPKLGFPLNKWVTVDAGEGEPAIGIVGPPAPSCDDIDNTEPPWDASRGYIQHEGIMMFPFDGVSDEPQEIYNFLKEEGIANVIIMGVHTNECVLKRAYGIRALKELGFNVFLVRDMTDSMYDSRNHPFVSHERATDIVIEHIETHLCGTITSTAFSDFVQQ